MAVDSRPAVTHHATMIDLDAVTAACGIIVSEDPERGFQHLATAWSVAPGEWITAWDAEEPPGSSARLVVAHGGACAPLTDWEEDGPLGGFRSVAAPAVLPSEGEGELHKRMELEAVGYPSVIDHPAFRLHRRSLTAERYFPYLCPWRFGGHLALFTRECGHMAGTCYQGMAGGPVFDAQARVVGLLLGGTTAPEAVPLATFHRFA